jgi:hypothetical protein
MGGDRGNHRGWANDNRPEPILRRVPNPESAGDDRGNQRPPPPGQSAPSAARPAPPAAPARQVEQATPPVANRVEPTQKRQPPPKVDPQDRKGSRDSYER